MRGFAILAAAALFAAAASGDGSRLRYTVGMGRFGNVSQWSGRWNLADAFAALLEDQLVQGGKFAPSESAGSKAGAQVSVNGAILRVEEAPGLKGGGFGFKGLSFNPELGAAEVEVSVTVADSDAGGKEYKTAITGKSRKGSVPLARGNSSWLLIPEMSGLEKDRIGGALSDAVNQAAAFVESQLDSIAWRGSVAAVRPDRLIINRGARDGVEAGMEFDIRVAENVVDVKTGELLDCEFFYIGTVRVVEVKKKISYTTPLLGAKRGMWVYRARKTLQRNPEVRIPANATSRRQDACSPDRQCCGNWFFARNCIKKFDIIIATISR